MLVMVLRNCMPFALVCMTGEGTQSKGNNSQKMYNLNFSSSNSSNVEKIYTSEFDYSSETQGLLISSSMYAAVISPVVGSFCSHKIGPKRCILLFVMTSGVLTLLTPLSARIHLYLVIGCRVLLGFTVNTILPALFDLWLYWAPVQEKEQLLALTFAGFSMALILQNTVSGFICLIPADNGWPFIFYVFGCRAVVWCVLWFFTAHETPENHPGITENKKIYITRNRTTHVKKQMKTPWKNIALSKPVWAYFIVFFCHDWNNGVLFGYLPLYMATVLKFDLTQNDLLSSLPYVSRIVATLCWSYLSVKLRKIMSVTYTRKLVMSIGYCVAAGLAVSLSYVPEDQEYIAVAIFICFTPFQIVSINSAILTPIDIAPQYASIITSVGMIFSFVGLMVSPLFVAFIITERTRQQWSTVFYTNAGVFILAAVVYLTFGSGEIQHWAVTVTEHSEKKSNDSDVYVTDSSESTHL